jgi:hypothetical protein
MTAGILQRKENKATQLTPVGMERGGSFATNPHVVFPWDRPAEAVQQEIVGIRLQLERWKKQADEARDGIYRSAGYIEDGLRQVESALEIPVGGPVIGTVTKVDEAVAVQRAKDEAADKWAKEYEAKARAAQEQVFVELDDPPASTPVVAGEAGWVCPKHGDEELRVLKSRKGRVYRTCMKCEEFER